MEISQTVSYSFVDLTGQGVITMEGKAYFSGATVPTAQSFELSATLDTSFMDALVSVTTESSFLDSDSAILWGTIAS